jgi:hypothetical protein
MIAALNSLANRDSLANKRNDKQVEKIQYKLDKALPYGQAASNSSIGQDGLDKVCLNIDNRAMSE